MPSNIYGTGGLYGTGLLYGRVAGGLVDAQEQVSRETALRASVIEEHLNDWELFTHGSVTNGGSAFRPLGNDNGEQNYAFYRMQYDVVLKPNGEIYRARVGDGGLTDFNIYHQTITDPTVAAQWNAWTLLYSGTHYGLAVAVEPNNTVHVYTSKSNGLYRDNSLIWSRTNIIQVRRVEDTYDALFITVVRQDTYGTGGQRVMDLYYTPDITTDTPVADPTNYRFFNVSVFATLLDDGSVLRFMSLPRYNPRSNNNGDTIVVCTTPSLTDNTPTALRVIRGLAGTVGHNIIRNIKVSKLSDGYYYMFYGETHKDSDWELTLNAGGICRWQRSKDGFHWSEPMVASVGVGYLIENSGYAWSPTFDGVARRPLAQTIYDISNYVPRVEFEIPRDNQEGSGKLAVANPAGIHDVLKPLSDRRLKLEVGLRTETGDYEYTQFNDWWIKRVIQEKDGSVNRLTLEFGDIWARLTAQLFDTFNFIGQLKWNDWSASKRNQAFNYYFLSDTNPVMDNDRLRTRGIVLYTGWKGQNGTAQAHFSSVSGNPALIFRYIDKSNYQFIEKTGSILTLWDRVNGVNTEIDNGACTSDTSPTLKIVFRFETYAAYVNGTLIFSGIYSDQPNVAPGYVGFKATTYTLSSFSFEDWEVPLNAEELIRTALAMGDYHDVSTGNSSSEELGIIWGPQTDSPTPGDGLRQALEAVKWQLVWMDGIIRVGSFKDLTITKVLQDRIIKTDYIDEANLRINMAAVDGNEDPWTEFDFADTKERDRQISAYFDLPELSDQDSVRGRAQEEIRLGKMGRTPGGDVPLYFDLWRMDLITWIDNSGDQSDVRIEGFSVVIDQGTTPSQRQTFDTSLYSE